MADHSKTSSRERHPIARFAFSGYGGIVVVFAGLGTIYGGAEAVGVDLPKPAMASDVKRLQGEIDGLNKKIAGAFRERVAIQVAILRGNLFTAQQRAKELQEQGKPVPPSLARRIYELKNQIEDLKINGRVAR